MSSNWSKRRRINSDLFRIGKTACAIFLLVPNKESIFIQVHDSMVPSKCADVKYSAVAIGEIANFKRADLTDSVPDGDEMAISRSRSRKWLLLYEFLWSALVLGLETKRLPNCDLVMKLVFLLEVVYRSNRMMNGSNWQLSQRLKCDHLIYNICLEKIRLLLNIIIFHT